MLMVYWEGTSKPSLMHFSNILWAQAPPCSAIRKRYLTKAHHNANVISIMPTQKYEVFHNPDHTVVHAGALATPEQAQAAGDVYTAEKAKRLKEFGGAAEALKGAMREPATGSEFDQNRYRNIFDEAERAAQSDNPQNTPEYNELEGFDEILHDNSSLASALNYVQQNGVTKESDGSYGLRLDGEQLHVDQQGTPIAPPERPTD